MGPPLRLPHHYSHLVITATSPRWAKPQSFSYLKISSPLQVTLRCSGTPPFAHPFTTATFLVPSGEALFTSSSENPAKSIWPKFYVPRVAVATGFHCIYHTHRLTDNHGRHPEDSRQNRRRPQGCPLEPQALGAGKSSHSQKLGFDYIGLRLADSKRQKETERAPGISTAKVHGLFWRTRKANGQASAQWLWLLVQLGTQQL